MKYTKDQVKFAEEVLRDLVLFQTEMDTLKPNVRSWRNAIKYGLKKIFKHETEWMQIFDQTEEFNRAIDSNKLDIKPINYGKTFIIKKAFKIR